MDILGVSVSECEVLEIVSTVVETTVVESSVDLEEVDTTIGEPGNFCTQEIGCTLESPTAPDVPNFITPEILTEGDDSGDTLEGDITVVGNTSKDGKQNAIVVEKVESVEESNDNKRFTNVRKYSKRTALQRKMEVEKFDSASEPIFQQNKSGFLTERPIQWMIAIEKYVDDNNDVEALWRYKVDDEDKYYECEIAIWFSTTTEITVTLSLVTGVLMVKGIPFRKFIGCEFQKIAKYVLDDDELIKLDENTKADPEADGELSSAFDQITSNKIAIQTVQESVVKLLQILEETNKKQDLVNNVATTVVKDDLLALEKKYDQKLTVFMETYEKQVAKRFERTCKSFDDKLASIKLVISTFKMSTQNQINEMYEQLNKIRETELGKLEQDLNELRGNLSISGRGNNNLDVTNNPLEPPNIPEQQQQQNQQLQQQQQQLQNQIQQLQQQQQQQQEQLRKQQQHQLEEQQRLQQQQHLEEQQRLQQQQHLEEQQRL